MNVEHFFFYKKWRKKIKISNFTKKNQCKYICNFGHLELIPWIIKKIIMKSGDTSENNSSNFYLKGPKLANLSDDMFHMNQNFEALGIQEDSHSMTFQNPPFFSQNSSPFQNPPFFSQNSSPITPLRPTHLRRSSL